ncbi:MAG TPA: hypothetical protein VLB47_09185, partial [Solirubrobacteraceae bacterium]|nr:hypothetical protein [Solirubrobacteraceae bacterium]
SEGAPLRRARVTVSGAGVRRASRRTGRRGTATFRVRPRRSGALVVRVSARGWLTAATTVRVA